MKMQKSARKREISRDIPAFYMRRFLYSRKPVINLATTPIALKTMTLWHFLTPSKSYLLIYETSLEKIAEEGKFADSLKLETTDLQNKILNQKNTTVAGNPTSDGVSIMHPQSVYKLGGSVENNSAPQGSVPPLWPQWMVITQLHHHHSMILHYTLSISHRNRRTRMRALLFRFCLVCNTHGEQRW